MPREYVVRPSAKINVTLHVGPRRDDGFHDLRTIFQSIALNDTLRITVRRGPLTLRVSPEVAPADQQNLVWRAAERLWQALGRSGEPHGVQLVLEKAIPVAAGLGGGSSDAAAALLALHAIWKGRLPERELLRLAGTLGADVPFFLVGGTALGLGRGEDLVPAVDIAPSALVVIKPDVNVSTPDAYRWLDEDRAARVTDEDVAASFLETGWPTGPLALVNDLQAPVCRRHVEVPAMLEALTGVGASAAAMSGSGSAVFGVFSPGRVERAARRLRRPGWRVLVTRTLMRREVSRRLRTV